MRSAKALTLCPAAGMASHRRLSGIMHAPCQIGRGAAFCHKVVGFAQLMARILAIHGFVTWAVAVLIGGLGSACCISTRGKCLLFNQREFFLGKPNKTAIECVTRKCRPRYRTETKDLEMTTSVNAETATIIQFPLRGRMNAVAQSRNARMIEEALVGPLHDYGSWYHEEAVAESAESRKPQA
jgi:hypothetical protein